MIRNFINDTWYKFNCIAREMEIILFGYNGAKKLLDEMYKYGKPWNIIAIIDNDEKKVGSHESEDGEKIPIILPKDIYTIESNPTSYIVLICGTYISEMAEQLEKMGIHNYYSEFWMNYPAKLKKRIIPQFMDINKINEVKTYLYDNESAEVLDKVVEKRRNGILDYTDIMYRGNEYFIEEYWRPEWDGVIVDGGSYNGDTIEEIDFVTKGKFRKIYSFEPQQNLFLEMQNKHIWRWGGTSGICQ